MKVAVLSDAHSNSAGLQAVLEDIATRGGVGRIIFAGDAVGYYPDVNEVCDILREKTEWCVRGNHDAYVTGDLALSEDRKKVCGLEYTLAHISSANMKWLRGLPDSLEIELSGKVIRVFHGSPWNPLEEYVYPDNPLFDRFDIIEADHVVMGHTHYPMVKRAGLKTIVNPGSCGQPRDYNPSASYAVIDLDSGHVELHRVDYDRVSLIQKARELGVDEKVIQILSRTNGQKEGKVGG